MALIETWTDFLGFMSTAHRNFEDASITVALEEFEKIEKVPLTLFLFICLVAFLDALASLKPH